MCVRSVRVQLHKQQMMNFGFGHVSLLLDTSNQAHIEHIVEMLRTKPTFPTDDAPTDESVRIDVL
jgi:hypothetical protein